MGHVLGAEKGNFLIRGRGRPTVYGGHAGGILSIPAQEVSLGSPRVSSIHVQSPTPHAPPLEAFLTEFSQQTTRFSHLLDNHLIATFMQTTGFSNGTARCPRMLPGPRTCYRTSRAQKTRRVLVRGSGSTMNRHTHIAATKTQRAENEGRGRHTHTTDTLRARCDGRRERSGRRAPNSI